MAIPLNRVLIGVGLSIELGLPATALAQSETFLPLPIDRSPDPASDIESAPSGGADFSTEPVPSGEAKFSIAMPATPTADAKTTTVVGGVLTWDLSVARTDEDVYGVAYTDLPLDILASGYESVIESLLNRPLVDGVDWQALANDGHRVYLDDIPGQEYLHLSSQRFSNLRLYLVNRRLYVVMAASPDLQSVNQFVDSFEVDSPWRSFVSESGGFSVNVPMAPIVTPQQTEYQGTPLNWWQFTVYNLMAPEDAYQIAYADLPETVRSTETDKLLADIANQVFASAAADTLSRPPTSITLDSYPGLEYKATHQSGLSYVLRLYRVNDRVYGILAGSRSLDNLTQLLSSFQVQP